MKQLSEMILPNKLNTLLVNEPHVQVVLATVLKCSVQDVPELVDGETEFQTVDGPVTLVRFVVAELPHAMEQYHANSEHVMQLHARAAREHRTFLVVSSWTGPFNNPRLPIRRLMFLSSRTVVVDNDGSGAMVLRDRSGDSGIVVPCR